MLVEITVHETHGPKPFRLAPFPSAYNLYFRDEREKILQEIPSRGDFLSEGAAAVAATKKCHYKICFSDLGKTIGNRWKKLDETVRKEYEAIAEKGRREYNKKIAEWSEQREALGLPTRKIRKKQKKAKVKQSIPVTTLKKSRANTSTRLVEAFDTTEDLEPLPLDTVRPTSLEQMWMPQATIPNPVDPFEENDEMGDLTVARMDDPFQGLASSNAVPSAQYWSCQYSSQLEQGLRKLQDLQPHEETTRCSFRDQPKWQTCQSLTMAMNSAWQARRVANTPNPNGLGPPHFTMRQKVPISAFAFPDDMVNYNIPPLGDDCGQGGYVEAFPY